MTRASLIVAHSRSARTVMRGRAAQCGLSMVELLVGTTIALIVTAAGATLLAGNLREDRRLLLEARLMQDLRTAADVVSRDLRRAGYWGAATDGISPSGTGATASNPYAAVAPMSAASDAVSFRYSRDATENQAVDSNEQFGFRLRGAAIEMQLGAGKWQALTDPETLSITGFSVTPTVQSISLADLCESPCTTTGEACPPRQQVRSFAVTITGRLAGDSNVTRSLRSQVRLRNDPVVGRCGA